MPSAKPTAKVRSMVSAARRGATAMIAVTNCLNARKVGESVLTLR